MKLLRFIILFLIGFCCPWLWSQSTSVSVTVQSPNTQAWINGTLSYLFVKAPNFSGKSQWQNADLPSNYLISTTLNLDNTGSATFTLPSNTAITPAGSSWAITVCPQATVQCVTTNVPVTGSTENISAAINANINNISVPGTVVPLAYQDSEITTQVRAGSFYYNTTTNQPRIYTGSIWTTFGGGTGGTPAGVNTDIQINSGGNFGTDTPGLYTYNTTTHTQTLQNLNQTGITGQTVTATSAAPLLYQGTINNPGPLTTAGTGNDEGVFPFVLDLFASGEEKSIGNPPGVDSADGGWRVWQGFTLRQEINSAGIAQWLNFQGYKNGVSDNAVINFFDGPWTTGGWVTASDEATEFIRSGGTQFPGLCKGQITSTTGPGDTHPVLNCSGGGGSGFVVSNGYLFDLDKKILTTHMVGTVSTLWAGNSLGLGEIAVTPHSVTPSTGICTTSTFIQSSPTLNQPSLTGVTCTATSGTMVPGKAWIAGYTPEQITITAVAGTALSILSARPHNIGDIIFQGGTQGSFSPEDDVTSFNNLLDVITFGAADDSDLILGYRKQSGISAVGLPRVGSWASGNNLVGAVDVYPMANVLSVDGTGSGNLQVEQNNINWAVNDHIASPSPSSYVEALANFLSSQQSYENGSAPSLGLSIGAGSGWDYGSYLLKLIGTPAGFYRGGPWNLGGTIDPPNGISSRFATLGEEFAFSTPIPSIANSNAGCVLCNYDDSNLGKTHSFALYINFNASGSGIYADYPLFTTDFDGLASVRSISAQSAVRLTTMFDIPEYTGVCINDQNTTPLCSGFYGASVFHPGFHIVNPAGGPFDYNGVGICLASGSCLTPLTFTVPNGTVVSANSCNSGTGITATGTTSASSVSLPTPTTNITAITGWSVTTGSLSLSLVPSTNLLTWAVCNATTSSITTGASVTFNIRVMN